MEEMIIRGGQRLCGTVRVPGAKNAALPIMAACILTQAPVTLLDVPDLLDTRRMEEILRSLGCEVVRCGSTLFVDAGEACRWVLPDALTSLMRASVFLLGPLLARFGHAEMIQPGGCPIGARPVDYHLRALEEMGAHVDVSRDGKIVCSCDELCGCELRLPYPSVGATENLMMAAVTARGITVIENAAREPEIMDLQAFLNELGADITGAGTSRIVVQGVESLCGSTHRIISDRIVAGSLLAAVAATRGEITLLNCCPHHLQEPVRILRQAGCYIRAEDENLWLRADTLRGLGSIRTGPYPAFPTDLQAPFCALACTAQGETQMVETVFENRFHHLGELQRMGACVEIVENRAYLSGAPLHAATVMACDLRGGMALVTAALAARGESRIRGLHHIDRGYQSVDNDISALGAQLYRR